MAGLQTLLCTMWGKTNCTIVFLR